MSPGEHGPAGAGRPGDRAREFERHRDALTRVAYGMVGSLAEARDLVQDTYVRWSRAAGDPIRSPRAWLTRTVTRLAVDHMRSARVRREQYVGTWLPEPVLTGVASHPAPDVEVERAEALSLALLRVLETLSPPERAAFLLHDTFGYGYDEIAGILDRSEAACRQLVSRARRRVAANRPRFATSEEERRRLAETFFQAARTGTVEDLVELLADDATLWSDGGGRVASALNPIHGATNIARFLVGVRQKFQRDLEFEAREVNGERGLIARLDGRPDGVYVVDVADGRVTGIYVVRNPDKLAGM